MEGKGAASRSCGLDEGKAVGTPEGCGEVLQGIGEHWNDEKQEER